MKRGRIQKAGTGSSTGTLLLITDGSSSLNVDNKNLGEQEDDSSDNSSTDLASAAAKVRRIQQQITRKSTRRNCEKGKFTASSIFMTPENNGLSGGLADLNIDGRVGANGQESSGVGMLSNSSYDVNEWNLNVDFIQLSQEASIVRDSLLQENSQASTYLGGSGGEEQPQDRSDDDDAAAQRDAEEWFDQLDPNLKLVDIPINKLGHICNLNNAIDIPYHWLGRIREIFTQYLKKSNEASTPEERLKYAVRYKLLSLALLGKSAKSSRSFVPLNKLLSTRCALLKRDDWSQFLVVHYARPESVGNRQVLTDDERRQLRHRKVTQLIHSGEIGKGARRLAQPEIRDGDRLSSEEMLDKLRALHPVRNPQIASLLTPEMQRELEEFQASPENHVTIDIKRLLSLKILRHKLIKGGFTKTRYEHLAALLEVNRSEQSPAARQFAEHYVRYLEMLVNGNLPDAFYGILADVEATGIQKPKASSKDIRPIGFNDIDRRLLFAYLTPIAEEETRQRFAAASQVANQPSAAEKYIFSVQAGLEACRSHDMGDLDAKAAFQKVPTDFLLYSVYKAHPWLYPFVSRVYGKNRHVFVNLDHNVYEFTASMGVTQGCVGAGYLYNLVTVPLLERIREVIYAVAAPIVGAAANADQSQSQQSNFSYTPALSDLQGAGGRLGLSQLRQQHRRRFHA